MSAFWGILGALLGSIRLAYLALAYVVVFVGEALTFGCDWCDERAGGPRAEPEPDDRMRTMHDIVTDFTAAQRMAYEEDVGCCIPELVEDHGSDFVYWDIHDWYGK